jgi:glycolate oxidase FAD binding subunit
MSGVATGVPTDLASVGGGASSEPGMCAFFAVDGVAPACVLSPSTPEQVAELVRSAADRGLALIPWGNGTKLGIGAPPRRYDAALCLRDLNRTTYYEPDDLVVSVEPGMSLGTLQQMLSERRLWLPLDPAGGDRATIGGILAANSAGPLRLRYGGPRDTVLGMKIATTDGKIVKTGGRVVKNVAGYDLAKLLIGSYGTLGVIVEATFKLYPQIAARATWTIEIDSLARAREFRRRLLASPLRPLRAVLLNAAACARLESGDRERAGNCRAAIWIEAGGSERVIARYESEISALAGEVNAEMERVGSSEAEKRWNRVADFGNWMHRECQSPLVVKAALPIAAAEEFLERAQRDTLPEGGDVIGIAQLGVGVVELGVGSRTPNPEPTPSPASVERLRQLARDLGGSVIVTHCPAELKSEIDVWGPPDDDSGVMRKLREAWDPKSTLAPGRMPWVG